ncbi:hypothetical protein PAAL109150_26060 [Paenibacillus alkaliterrae]
MEAITDLLVPLMNSTKQWVIKGFSPEELSAKRASAGMVLNAASNRAVQANVIDIKRRKKLGATILVHAEAGKNSKNAAPNNRHVSRLIEPGDLKAIQGLDTLEFHPKVTYIVGENGMGEVDADGSDRDWTRIQS